MADHPQRLNYFKHQFLNAEDFLLEQRYHLDMRRRHNRLLHTPGVADGLDVKRSTTNAAEVIVEPGIAIDGNGREIVVLESQTLSIPSHPEAPLIYITIRYVEHATDPPPSSEVQGFTRYTEQFEIDYATVAPVGTSEILLATAVQMGTGVEELDPTVRPLASGLARDDQVLSRQIKEADGASAQNTDLGSGIKTGHIQDGAVTSRKIADGTIQNANLAPGLITSDKIADGTIVTNDLANGAITSAKIAAQTIVNANLALGSVTNDRIAAGTIGTNNLGDGAITSAKIAPGQVGNSALADGSVTSAKIADGAIGTNDLATSAVTSDKIVDGTIRGSDVAVQTITSDHLKRTPLISGSAGLNANGTWYAPLRQSPADSVPFELYHPVIQRISVDNVTIDTQVAYRQDAGGFVRSLLKFTNTSSTAVSFWYAAYTIQ